MWFIPVFIQSSVSHDPSEIIINADLLKKIIFIIIDVENSCAASYFCGNHDRFFQIQNYIIYLTW